LRHRFYQQSGRGQFGNLDQIVMAESAPAYVEHRGNPAQIQVPLFDWQDKKEPLLAKCLRGQVPERIRWKSVPGGGNEGQQTQDLCSNKLQHLSEILVVKRNHHTQKAHGDE